MKTTILILLMGFFISKLSTNEGFKVGDKATDFSLKNIDGKMISLDNYKKAKGFVLIFTCNHCPYVKAYEDRIITIDKTYKSKGYPVIAINSNDEKIVPEDSYENMKIRAQEKGFTFPYLYDQTQEIANKYGATRTPHVFLLNRENNQLIVRYIGAIDNNYQDASAVTETYLTNAIESLLAKESPNPDFTKAIGCSIKRK